MTGRVYLVGAGPGDPDLITLRGADVLRRADVVVYDRLVSGRLLDFAPPWAERVYAGKAPGEAAMDQDVINALLVERARQGRVVVRLKGGDPFVFGRGGEEALACAQAGVAFQIVPGVSSAFAAPGAAGIPVTHRGVASSVLVMTATGVDGRPVDLAPAVRGADTLVLLMAAGRLRETCEALVAAGRPSTEAAAVVQWATTDRQRSVRGTLTDVADLAAARRLGPPATLVVGEVTRLCDLLHGLGRIAETQAAEATGDAAARAAAERG